MAFEAGDSPIVAIVLLGLSTYSYYDIGIPTEVSAVSTTLAPLTT